MGWHKGIVEWREGKTVNLSVVFTWDVEDAYARSLFLRRQGFDVRVGGPGVFTMRKHFDGVAEIGGDIPDTVRRHNALATFASRGCPVGCWFCIVPAMEGRDFTEIDDFPVRPILCDNNLSALRPEFQDHIVKRYQDENVPLIDANSGFEPRTFDEDVFHRWKPILKGPWRFALDDQGDLPHVERVAHMLRDVNRAKKRVYVLIGNEPFEQCLDRVMRVISWNCEPYCQPVMKLNAKHKRPWVRHDWTPRLLSDMQRWANRRFWKYTSFADYDQRRRTQKPVSEDQGVLL